MRHIRRDAEKLAKSANPQLVLCLESSTNSPATSRSKWPSRDRDVIPVEKNTHVANDDDCLEVPYKKVTRRFALGQLASMEHTPTKLHPRVTGEVKPIAWKPEIGHRTEQRRLVKVEDMKRMARAFEPKIVTGTRYVMKETGNVVVYVTTYADGRYVLYDEKCGRVLRCDRHDVRPEADTIILSPDP